MREIELRGAKASLSSSVDDAVQGKPSIITRQGNRVAVVVGFEEWERLVARVPSFGRLLMSGNDLPPQSRKRIRRSALG
jgi:antitoxin Phd